MPGSSSEKPKSKSTVDKPEAGTYPGSHSFLVNGCRFIVDTKYKPLKPLGQGAYGVVCSAIDQVTKKKVAVKKIPKAFEDIVDAKRIIREVKLLRHFAHENVIGLVDMVAPIEGMEFNDVYMVMDFMETDLYKIIYSKNALTDEHIQYFVYQLLCGLKYIHSSGVIHRDLKPSNLLLNGNCDLKICDFGLARGTSEEKDYQLTEYVVTRWYRAPEIMCSCSNYDFKIDVWAAGCIMGELLGRKPLFPGDDYIKQINLIFDVLGTPSEEETSFISNVKALEYIKSLRARKKIPFDRVYKNANPDAIDLLDKMLTFNPNNRISVEEALQHPYLASLHAEDCEPMCDRKFDFSFEKREMTKLNLQDEMWKEILKFRKDAKPIYERVMAKERTLEAEKKKAKEEKEATKK